MTINLIKKYNPTNIALKVFLLTAMLIFYCLIVAVPVKAADLDINCSGSQKDCSKSNNSPLFSQSDGWWYPGMSVSKRVVLKNSGKTEQEVTIQTNQRPNKDNLDKVLQIVLADNNNKIIWGGSLAKFYSKKTIGLGSLKAGKNLEIRITLKMDKNAPLIYQNQKENFDLTFNFRSNQVDNQDKKKDKGKILGQSIQESSDQSWVSKLFTAIRELLSKVISVFNFLNN